jgi:hypothetical protein
MARMSLCATGRRLLHCSRLLLLPDRAGSSFGAAFVTFYRLVGPFRLPEAPYIVKTEIWETVTRRGLLGNLFMGVVSHLARRYVPLTLSWPSWPIIVDD